ncbi:MAG: LytTR family DNA-binding domain-containing protein [Bacteroidota bacterium]
MLNIFNKPYPPSEPGKTSILLSAGLGLLVGAFLIFFEPFDISRMDLEYKTIKIALYGVITFLAMLFFLHFLPMLAPKLMSDKHWKVKHEIVFLMLMIFFIATLNGLYVNYINELDFSWRNYYIIIRDTAIVGIVPICFIVLIDQNRKWQKYAKAADSIQLQEAEILEELRTSKIQIPLPNNASIIEIDPIHLLFIEADGNYVEVRESVANEVSKQLHRTTLSYLESQLYASHIVKCHRSFLVNLNQVTKVEGNAQGFRLTLQEGLAVVPVSRKFVPMIKSFFAES